MLFKTPASEAKPLSPQEASQLKKTVQNATIALEKESFDTQPMEKIVHRLLAVKDDLSIEIEQDAPQLICISEGSRQVIARDLRKLEDLFICERKMGIDDSHEAVLNLFPSDMMGEAFLHAIHASCRLEELRGKKDKKIQERAFNNFLHLIHCLNILENPKKAANALQKRRDQYQKQIEAHQRNIQNSKAKKKTSDIPRSEEKIRYFQAKITWLQSHIAALDAPI